MYAVIDIPRFALQSVLRLEPDLQKAAAIVVDASLTKPLVVDCTSAAKRRGIVIGLTVPQAIGRCEAVAVRYCSETAEAMAGRVLFDGAYSLSPRVEETFPGVCTIGLSGVNRKTLVAQCQKVLSELKRLDLRGRMGIAATPDLALLVAREAKGVMRVDGRLEDKGSNGPEAVIASDVSAGYNQNASSRSAVREEDGPSPVEPFALEDFLSALPLRAAEPPVELERILEQWGIRSAGAFAALPREAVGKRLGMAGLALWDRVSGREERPLLLSDLPLTYEESLEFEYDVEALEPLLFLIRRFLDQLCLRLRAAHQVAESIHLKLELADIRLEDGERVEAVALSFKVPEPTGDAATLFLLLATRLEAVETDAAVVGISLKIDPIDHDTCQLGLFETSLKDPHRFAQTVSRIAGIVGPENIGRPSLEATGRPDGVHMERLPASVPPLKSDASTTTFGLALRRFRPPLAAEVEIRDRQPAWFRCPKAGGSVTACRGPWIFSGQWWDEAGWNRVEWDVELRTGGVYRLVKEKGRWWVEGVYD